MKGQKDLSGKKMLRALLILLAIVIIAFAFGIVEFTPTGEFIQIVNSGS